MTQTKLLIGSLSSDLYRIATLSQRGSYTAAERFLEESKRWIAELHDVEVKAYIRKIIDDIQPEHADVHSLAEAEKFLMYGVLLQNYAMRLE